ncbi:MAG: hypothetical protein JO263_03415 [Candidatus Eremiobacteraeota bacterium]|nr:hypothetical protein [Candidatus Eremiobacteraeota bacterium]
MRTVFFAFAAALVAVALSVGPSNAASSSPLVLGNWAARSMYLDPSGMAHMNQSAVHKRPPLQHNLVNFNVHNLALSDASSGAVRVYNTYGVQTQYITNRVSCPDGLTYDNKGDLYVTNYCLSQNTVVEYNPGQVNAAWVYSAGLFNPVNVSTDKNDNVYVAGFLSGTVTEFAHRTNAVLHQCSAGGYVEGITIDGAGDVFVSYGNNLVEYKGGLAGCSQTPLSPTLGFAGGLILDKPGNLLAEDQFGGVDVIPPPYTTIKTTIAAFCGPFHEALSGPGNLLFVTDDCVSAYALTYPHDFFYAPLSGYGAAFGIASD